MTWGQTTCSNESPMTAVGISTSSTVEAACCCVLLGISLGAPHAMTD